MTDTACICHEHNPVCTCIPFVEESASIAPELWNALPAPFQATRAQLRFMRLHAWHLVERWQWHWFQTMLRATTDRGVTATLWADSVEELIQNGLMEAGMGFCMTLTDAGREMLARERNRV